MGSDMQSRVLIVDDDRDTIEPARTAARP